MHAVEPVDAVHFPAEQLKQMAVFPMEYLPPEQAVQSAEKADPDVSEYLPATQLVQLVEPATV
jgi:hypothetical protein